MEHSQVFFRTSDRLDLLGRWIGECRVHLARLERSTGGAEKGVADFSLFSLKELFSSLLAQRDELHASLH